MGELTCAETYEAAAEFALGVLPEPQRSEVAAHLLRCPNCGDEVGALIEIATRLADLVPGTEPPLGFDRSVLGRIKPRRRPRTLAIGMVAALFICVLVAGTLLDIAGRSYHQTTPPRPAGVFRENGAPVGMLTARGRPLWVSVTVRGVAVSGPVSCQLVSDRGLVESVGTFDLVHGSGSWAAPDPAGIAGDRQARLVDRSGQVIATAALP